MYIHQDPPTRLISGQPAGQGGRVMRASGNRPILSDVHAHGIAALRHPEPWNHDESTQHQFSRAQNLRERTISKFQARVSLNGT